jgi:putative ubiquitin-RnfH superfamily antitoxin RatB of RatAB toxin-antitoxin module
MHVEVTYALPEKQHRVHLELEQGATVGEALDAVRRVPPFDSLPLDSVAVGVFGRLASRDTLLGPGDLVEIYRPLQVEPGEARRRRAEG